MITGVYMWFNQVTGLEIPLQRNDLEKYFSPDFVMEMNDEIITHDYESLFNHFEKFRKSGCLLKVQMPLKEIVVSDDRKKCVARYNITKILPDKKTHTIKVIAIWHLSEDGRLNRMNEVVHIEK